MLTEVGNESRLHPTTPLFFGTYDPGTELLFVCGPPGALPSSDSF